MKIVAKHNNIRHSPFKMRVVANEVKTYPLPKMRSLLKLSQKKAARYILKVLDAAIANAKHNFEIEADDLVLVEMQIGEGRRQRKTKFRARGRRDIIRSRYSNIRIVLKTTKPAPVELKAKEDKSKKGAVKKDKKDTKKETKMPTKKVTPKKAKKEDK